MHTAIINCYGDFNVVRWQVQTYPSGTSKTHISVAFFNYCQALLPGQNEG